MHKLIPPTDDFSLYDTQYCTDCGRVCLVATDDPEKRREWGGQRHVCGDLGKALHQAFPSDLGARPVDDLKKSYYYESRNEPEQTGTSESTLGDNRG